MRRTLPLAARGESSTAFDWRCLPAGCVASRSNTAGILRRRALPARAITGLGATRAFRHGLLGAARRDFVGSPELRAGAEKVSEPQSGVAGDGALPVENRGDAVGRHLELARKRRGAHVERVAQQPAVLPPVRSQGPVTLGSTTCRPSKTV